MPSNKKLLQAAAGSAGGDPLYAEDVFSTYLYDGTGAAQTITNGIDLAGEGGMIWLKARDRSGSDGRNVLMDTERVSGSGDYFLYSDGTEAQSGGADLTTYNSDGFRITAGYSGWNSSGYNYASWTFRKAEKFFDVVEFEAPTSASDNFRVSHNLGSVPACIIVKSVDVTGDWYVYHSSLETPRNDSLKLNTTAASAASGDFWGEANPTTTDFGVQVRNFGTRPVTTSAGTYIAYLFASDAGGYGDDEDENIIKCGSYTGNGSATGPEIDLGFEPQFLLFKQADAIRNWTIFDVMRNFGGGDISSGLNPNDNGAEVSTANPSATPTATGFRITTANASINASGGTYIYMAIRRPMKTPESGTEVFAMDTEGSTGDGNAPSYRSPFPVDMSLQKPQLNSSGGNPEIASRLTGAGYLRTNLTADEQTRAYYQFDYMNGYYSSTGSYSDYFSYMFKRATGFMDVVAYTGDGTTPRNITHNLGAVPEFIVTKRRNAVGAWPVYNPDLGITSTSAIRLNTNDGSGYSQLTRYPSTPTSTVFTVGNDSDLNASAGTYVSYLFATVAGVSKVGSYTGTAADLNVDCGFTAGARFILIKRYGSAGDWYVWDTFRGITAGNDPYFLLNDAAAEVTNTDYIDPLNSGFIATTNGYSTINVNGGTYIFLAIA